MEVILLNKVENLGSLGDKVKVKNGYARNFLIPAGKAKIATPANLIEFEARRAEFEAKLVDALSKAESRKIRLEQLPPVTVYAKVGAEGKLYGSIGTVDIVEAVRAAGVELEKHEVRLPHGPLRQAGEHEVTLHLHADVNAVVKIMIQAEEETS